MLVFSIKLSNQMSQTLQFLYDAGSKIVLTEIYSHVYILLWKTDSPPCCQKVFTQRERAGLSSFLKLRMTKTWKMDFMFYSVTEPKNSSGTFYWGQRRGLFSPQTSIGPKSFYRTELRHLVSLFRLGNCPSLVSALRRRYQPQRDNSPVLETYKECTQR